MSDWKERNKKVKLYEDLGAVLHLEIEGYIYYFDKQLLPSSVKRLEVGQSCNVMVILEGRKIIGIKNGHLVAFVKS